VTAAAHSHPPLIDVPNRPPQTGKGTCIPQKTEPQKAVDPDDKGTRAMSTSPPPGSGPGSGPGSVGRRIEEAVELIEMELRHAITYVNDAVIPQVRRESISAMRSLSDTLRNLADRIERHQQQPKGPQT
jgi:hypothetical protein